MKTNILIVLFLVVSINTLFSGMAMGQIEGRIGGYNAVVAYNDGFLAVSSDGRVEMISRSGQVIRSEEISSSSLYSIVAYRQWVLAAGSEGSIYLSSGAAPFKRLFSGTTSRINSMTVFHDVLLACAGKEILAGDENGIFAKIEPDIKGEIISLSSGEKRCYAVTDAGEILSTQDGEKWVLFDFNEVYRGYYEASFFTSVVVTGSQVVVAGRKASGAPVVMVSTQGNVWTELPLTYTDDEGNSLYLHNIPNQVYYDSSTDQFFLSCEGGVLFLLPSCSHCYKLLNVDMTNIYGVAVNNGTLICIGENNAIVTFQTNRL